MKPHDRQTPFFVYAKPALFFLISIACFTGLRAQPCSNYADANAANYLTRINFREPAAGFVNPFFADMDADGDLDCYVSDVIKAYRIRYFKNIGTATVPLYEQANPAGGFSVSIFNRNGIQQLADLDGDGDFDCFIVPYNPSGAQTIRFFENGGTTSRPLFVQNDDANPFRFVSGKGKLYFTIADIDSDGDYDFYYSDNDHDYLYENTGTSIKPAFELIKSGDLVNNSRLYFDWNKDGLVDYFDYKGRLYYRNTGPSPKDLHYVADAGGPSFAGVPIASLQDITGDGIPEAFSTKSDMLTVTPVATIVADTGMLQKVILRAQPNSNAFTYSWQYNGMEISSAATAAYAASKPGLYTVKISDSCGTGVSLPYKFRLYAFEGNEAIASNKVIAGSKQVGVYPNPFMEQFTLRTGNDAGQPVTIKISDATGRLVSLLQTKENIVELGAALTKGVYLLQVYSDDEIIYTGKLVKQ